MAALALVTRSGFPALLVLLAAAAPAAADPTPPKPSAVRCTLEGPELSAGDDDPFEGLAVAPDGAVVVLDGGRAVRRYVAAAGAGCTLQPDRRFGQNGSIALDAAVRKIDVDRDGTIYASHAADSRVQRISHGTRAPMCGRGRFYDPSLTASPDSDHVWRWDNVGRILREDRACTVTKSIDTGLGSAAIGNAWAIGDGFGVDIDYDNKGDSLLLYDGEGRRVGQIPNINLLKRAVACGALICAANAGGMIGAWRRDGTEVLESSLDALLGTKDALWTVDGFAMRGGTAYIYGFEDSVSDYSSERHYRPPVIVRVDGLPR